ncbi:MAG: hypothetical protein ABIQ64_01670 [Candidatus Saccharimonadales bacterium]
MPTKTRPPHLLLHDLITSLSYWGTAVRILLIGFVLFIANILTIIGVDSSGAVQSLAAQYIYFMGSLLLLDAGYVTIARSLPMADQTADKWLFLLFIAVLASMIVVPFFAAVPNMVLVSVQWVFLVSLFVLALRLVLGLILGHRVDKR